MKKTVIYVCCHNKIKKPKGGCFLFKYLQVGTIFSKTVFYKLNDNLGESISSRNGSYNELTGLYWIWKNDNQNDIVGMCHYRRYFRTSSPSKYFPFFLKIMNKREINTKLKTSDIICIPIQLGTETYNRFDHNGSSIRKKDVCVIKNIISKSNDKRYVEAFDLVMKRNWNYLLNMFICKKELLNLYCDWLFDILFKFEKEIKYDELVDSEKRIFGLWGEYLLNVFVIANKIKVSEAKCINTSSPYTPFTFLKEKALKKFKKFH